MPLYNRHFEQRQWWKIPEGTQTFDKNKELTRSKDNVTDDTFHLSVSVKQNNENEKEERLTKCGLRLSRHWNYLLSLLSQRKIREKFDIFASLPKRGLIRLIQPLIHYMFYCTLYWC